MLDFINLLSSSRRQINFSHPRFLHTQIPAHQINLLIGFLGKASKKTNFFGENFPKCRWVGWLIPKQGANPSKKKQINPKIAFFDPNYTFRFPKSHKNPGVGGWVNTFGKDIPKKTFFFIPSLINFAGPCCDIQIVSGQGSVDGIYTALS